MLANVETGPERIAPAFTASAWQAAKGYNICVTQFVISREARNLTSNRRFARSFAFAQDDNE